MKKVIAIMLCMMVGVSCFALGAFAEGEPEVITTVYGHTYQEGEGTPSPDNVRNISGDVVQYVDIEDGRYLLGSTYTLFDGDYIEIYSDGSYSVYLYSKLNTYNNSSGWVVTGSTYSRFRRFESIPVRSMSNYLVAGNVYNPDYGIYAFLAEVYDNLYIKITPEVNSLDKLGVYLANMPLQVLSYYSEPVVSSGRAVFHTSHVGLVNNLRPFCTNIFTTISSVSNSIISTPVLLLSFGFFLIGGMIGLFGRMLSRG